MKCVIISKEKVIDLGKLCLSNLRDFVNNEYFLGFNEVKRLRTLYFMTCQMVFGEQLKSKENNSFVINNIMKYQNNNYFVELKETKENILNELWNEKIAEKYCEAKKYVIKSKVGNDESEVEEVFNTPVCEKYSRMEFSLEETDRIFDLIKDGLNKCFELNEDLYYEIKNFEKIYYVYKYCYKSLDKD